MTRSFLEVFARLVLRLQKLEGYLDHNNQALCILPGTVPGARAILHGPWLSQHEHV